MTTQVLENLLHQAKCLPTHERLLLIERLTKEFQAKEEPSVAIGEDVLSILNKNGFIGCLHSNEELSQNYKKYLNWNHKL